MSQNTRRATRAFGAVLITMGAWAASVSLTACADYPTNAHGPRINMWPGIAPTMIVRNESGSAVRIFPWIGKIDATDPSGAASCCPTRARAATSRRALTGTSAKRKRRRQQMVGG